MNCYVCDRVGRVTVAVAICGNCHVALCREHLDEELLTPGRGGTNYACSHDPGRWARAARAAGSASRAQHAPRAQPRKRTLNPAPAIEWSLPRMNKEVQP
jgi:hypothetical protein